MLGTITFLLLIIAFFVMADKGFSEDGIPLIGSRYIAGTAGRVVGAICGLIALALIGLLFYSAVR